MYDVEFLDECKNVSFGMMIKSVTGVEISGYANIAMEQTWIVRANAKSTVTPSFRLKCDLVQGTYFLNSGVIGTTAAGETCYLARTLDITAFKVVTVEPNPIRGFTNMSYQFDIRKSSFHSDAT